MIVNEICLIWTFKNNRVSQSCNDEILGKINLTTASNETISNYNTNFKKKEPVSLKKNILIKLIVCVFLYLVYHSLQAEKGRIC